MANLADLVVSITAQTKQFDKAIKDTKKKVQDTESGVKKATTAIKGMVTGVAVAALVAKIGQVAQASISAASDAEETQNKFNVVFSGMAADANEMAISLANSYGLSNQGAKDMLAGTGDLLTGLGFTQKSAFSLSEQVLTLGADLASFTNYSGGAEGASEALTKALLGEREMLKGLGISINEADLKAEVLRQTKSGLTFETEKQAKANATLTLVMNQSKNAMGDFERSQDSYANQTKIAKAATHDLQVEIGKMLLPVATDTVGIFGELTTKLSEYIAKHNELNRINDAFKNGTATLEDKIKVGEEELKQIREKIKTEQDYIDLGLDDYDISKGLVQELKNKMVWITQNLRLQKAELKTKQELIDKTKQELKTEQDIKDAKQAKYDANVKAVKQQDLLVQKVLDGGKSELDLINEEIKAITAKDLAEGEYKDRQSEALKLLLAEKQAILDDEAKAEKEKNEQIRALNKETRDQYLDSTQTELESLERKKTEAIELAESQGAETANIAKYYDDLIQKNKDENKEKSEKELKDQVDNYISITKQTFDIFDKIMTESYGEAISQSGDLLSEIGESTGSMELQVAGAIVSMVGDVVTGFESAARETKKIINELAQDTASILDKNQREWLERAKDNRISAAQEQESEALEIFLKTLSEKEIAQLKTDNVIKESTVDRLKRERDEAITTGDEILANQLKNEIAVAEIKQKTATETAKAEEEYKKAIAQMNYDMAVAELESKVATLKADKSSARAELWWNPAQKKKVTSSYNEAISTIQGVEIPLPQLATGAIIPGSQRGVDVTVGEGGNDELILGGGSKGDAILQRFADKINKNGGGNTINNYYSSMFAPLNDTDMRKFTRMQRPYLVADNQRIGADK